MESSGEEEVKYEKLGLPVEPTDTAIKDQLTEGAVGGPEPHPTMVALFQQLFTCLERRNKDLKQEFWGLRQSIFTAPYQAELVSESPRLGLPTPGRQRLNTAGTSTPQQAPQAVMRPAPAPGDQSSSVNVHLPAFLRKEPKMPSYQQGEDIENYLLRFESMAKTWQWPEVEWASRLVPLLTGNASELHQRHWVSRRQRPTNASRFSTEDGFDRRRRHRTRSVRSSSSSIFYKFYHTTFEPGCESTSPRTDLWRPSLHCSTLMHIKRAHHNPLHGVSETQGTSETPEMVEVTLGVMCLGGGR
ncbi:unnamed protein product [Oncorhynchus mykiss]|uniref:Uncharacterized protein n=1 Tax=Oncorhynchus mykiss TaxID=8022 RepID=A0A060VWH7_ONCMY|nr:unnamed protein product [Oncorhynchus mykiss]